MRAKLSTQKETKQARRYVIMSDISKRKKRARRRRRRNEREAVRRGNWYYTEVGLDAYTVC